MKKINSIRKKEMKNFTPTNLRIIGWETVTQIALRAIPKR